jgi:hypothetical protein
LVPQYGLAKSTACVDIKLLKLQPYRTAVIHSLLPPDYKARIQYCRWWQESVFSGLLGPEHMFYSDVVQFTLRDINSQNNILEHKNSHGVH